MKTHEIVRELTAAGFVLLKDGSRHQLYKKGAVVVPVVRSSSNTNPRAVRSLRAVIRRAARGATPQPGRYV